MNSRAVSSVGPWRSLGCCPVSNYRNNQAKEWAAFRGHFTIESHFEGRTSFCGSEWMVPRWPKINYSQIIHLPSEHHWLAPLSFTVDTFPIRGEKINFNEKMGGKCWRLMRLGLTCIIQARDPTVIICVSLVASNVEANTQAMFYSCFKSIRLPRQYTWLVVAQFLHAGNSNGPRGYYLAQARWFVWWR